MSDRPALTKTQHAIQLTAFGGPELLERVRTDVPEPGPGQVRIAVEASSVQYTDTLIRRGLYPAVRGPFPLVPGYDLVGVIDAVGSGVTAFSPGDRVADLCVTGGNARYALRPAEGLVEVPGSVDAAAATTLVLSWVTAYQALTRTARVASGERVLITGANGAVGRAAVVVARQLGAEVWASASEAHHGWLRELGATPLPRAGWLDEVTARGGVDVVLDGLALDGFVTPYRALRQGGRLVGIGVTAKADAADKLGMVLAMLRLGFWRVWPWAHTVRFYSITDERRAHPEAFREDLAQLLAWLEEGRIEPRVQDRIGLDEVAAAHARIAAGGLQGKLVVEPFRAGATPTTTDAAARPSSRR